MSEPPMADPFPVRFPERTARHLTVASARMHMTKTAIVRVAVQEWLARHADLHAGDAADTQKEQGDG